MTLTLLKIFLGNSNNLVVFPNPARIFMVAIYCICCLVLWFLSLPIERPESNYPSGRSKSLLNWITKPFFSLWLLWLWETWMGRLAAGCVMTWETSFFGWRSEHKHLAALKCHRRKDTQYPCAPALLYCSWLCALTSLWRKSKQKETFQRSIDYKHRSLPFGIFMPGVLKRPHI